METTSKNRTELKEFFRKNAIPTEAQFSEFINATFNQADDGVAKTPGNPLSIKAEGDSQGVQKLMNFYGDFGDSTPSWSISQNPRTDNTNPATNQPGFTISDASGSHRLFIRSTDGNVGIGNIMPAHKLDVSGNLRANTLINGGFDFVMGSNDQSSRGNSGGSRALVKGGGASLIINYGQALLLAITRWWCSTMATWALAKTTQPKSWM